MWHTHMCVYVCEYVQESVYVSVYVCVDMYVCMWESVDMHMFVCTCVGARVDAECLSLSPSSLFPETGLLLSSELTDLVGQ